MDQQVSIFYFILLSYIVKQLWQQGLYTTSTISGTEYLQNLTTRLSNVLNSKATLVKVFCILSQCAVLNFRYRPWKTLSKNRTGTGKPEEPRLFPVTNSNLTTTAAVHTQTQKTRRFCHASLMMSDFIWTLAMLSPSSKYMQFVFIRTHAH